MSIISSTRSWDRLATATQTVVRLLSERLEAWWTGGNGSWSTGRFRSARELDSGSCNGRRTQLMYLPGLCAHDALSFSERVRDACTLSSLVR